MYFSAAGLKYAVKVEYIVVPQGCEEEVKSSPLSGHFTTKPLAPSNFKLGPGDHEISWTKSPTPSVMMYKVKYRSVEEGSQAEDVMVPTSADSDTTTCSLLLKVSIKLSN